MFALPQPAPCREVMKQCSLYLSLHHVGRLSMFALPQSAPCTEVIKQCSLYLSLHHVGRLLNNVRFTSVCTM